MKLKSIHVGAILLVFLFGSIAVTSALGWWKTKNDKVPAKYDSGEFAGEYNPSDIRGSYSFQDITGSFDIPLEDLGIAFEVGTPSEYSSFQCKDLESIYAVASENGTEVGTTSVRLFVALYKGLPFDLSEDIYLPAPAVEVLKAKANLTSEQFKYLEEHIAANGNASPAVTKAPASVATASEGTINESASTSTLKTGPTTGSASSAISKSTSGSGLAEGSSSSAFTVKGSTTFQEVLDTGVKKEEIEKMIGGKIPDNGMKIKDLATEKGVEFSGWKTTIQGLADAIE